MLFLRLRVSISLTGGGSAYLNSSSASGEGRLGLTALSLASTRLVVGGGPRATLTGSAPSLQTDANSPLVVGAGTKLTLQGVTAALGARVTLLPGAALAAMSAQTTLSAPMSLAAGCALTVSGGRFDFGAAASVVGAAGVTAQLGSAYIASRLFSLPIGTIAASARRDRLGKSTQLRTLSFVVPCMPRSGAGVSDAQRPGRSLAARRRHCSDRRVAQRKCTVASCCRSFLLSLLGLGVVN